MIDFQCLRHTRAKKILRAMIMLYLILCSRMLKRHCRKARLRHLRDLRVIRVILRVIRTVVTRVLVSGVVTRRSVRVECCESDCRGRYGAHLTKAPIIEHDKENEHKKK